MSDVSPVLQPVFAEALPHDDELMMQPVPQVSCQQALAIAQQEYGLFGQMTLLQGERDMNFCLTVTPDERYMLKVINAAEPADVSDFQTSLLLHLASHAPELPVPRIRLTKNGRAEIGVDIGGVLLRVRLVSYLAGVPQHLASSSTALMPQLGARWRSWITYFSALHIRQQIVRCCGISAGRIRCVLTSILCLNPSSISIFNVFLTAMTATLPLSWRCCVIRSFITILIRIMCW